MTTEYRNGMTIKNFTTKGAAINYYNNIRMKDYVKSVTMCRDYRDTTKFQVCIIYNK